MQQNKKKKKNTTGLIEGKVMANSSSTEWFEVKVITKYFQWFMSKLFILKRY